MMHAYLLYPACLFFLYNMSKPNERVVDSVLYLQIDRGIPSLH
jgi:hypothetical protein